MNFFKYFFLLIALHQYNLSIASTVGDEFIKLGQEINNASLSSNQIHLLQLKINEVQEILIDGIDHSGFICVQGTVYGPNKFERWTGDSDSCSNTNKVFLKGDFACVMGTLYSKQGQLTWTGDSESCGNRTKVQIGNHYACAVGTIYGPGGFSKWTGDSNYCANAVLD